MRGMMRWAAMAVGMGVCHGVDLGLFVPLTQGTEAGGQCEGLGYDAELEGCVLPLSFAAMVSMGLLAVQQFNERDGSLVPAFAELGACEVEIEPTLFDCSFSQQLTVRNTIKMISADGFDASNQGVIGPATSSSAVAQSLITGALDVPQISYWATSPELDRDEVYQRFMRTIPTDPDVASAICSFWRNTQQYSFAGMLYVNDGYGEGFKEAILEECTRLGMERVFTYPYTQGDQASIAAQVTALAADDVFIYLVIAQPGDLPLIVEAADKFDMFQDSSWVVTDGSTSAELNQISAALRPKFNGTLRVASQGGSPKNEVWQKFADDFARFDARELLGYEQLPALWRDTYGSVFDQMEGLKDLSEVKDIGAFIFDAVATFGIQSCKYSTSEDVDSTGFGTYFFNTIQQLSFQGLSGEVEFLRNGNRAQNSSSFVMGNVIYSDEEDAASQVVQVGEYSNGGWEINKELIRFNGGSTTSPQDITVIVHDRHYSQIVKSIMYAMAAINISLAISAMIWTTINRKDNVVRAAQLPFLLTVALGLCTTSSSIIVFTIDDSSVPEEELFDLDKTSFASSACMASVSMYSIGFTLSFGALFIKMWRIRKLFNRKNVFRRVVVPTELAAFVFFVLISVDLSILVSWTLVNPLTFSRVIESEDQFNQIEESNGICRQSGSYVFLGLLITFHVIVLMGGNYLGWLCREINSTFAETKSLGIYMAGYVQVLIIAAPTLVIVSELPEIAMFIKGVVIFLNDLALILLLWVPKVLAVNYGFHDSSGQGGEFFTTPKPSEKATSRSNLDFQSSVEKTQVYTDTATFIPPSFRKPRDRSSAFASETTQQS